MPDINGIPYVESSDLVSAYPAASQALAQEVSDQLASKLPYSYGTATPSTTDSGFLWYDSNSTPAVPKYWDGSSFTTLAPAPGLELITSETFSAVSAVSLNGCFTAAHDSYSLLVNLTNTTNNTISMRLRASGSDASGANYSSEEWAAAASSVFASRATGATSWNVAYVNTSTAYLKAEIYGPALAAPTYAIPFSSRDGASVVAAQNGNYHSLSSAYDGFSLFPITGTITGTIRVYGYKI